MIAPTRRRIRPAIAGVMLLLVVLLFTGRAEPIQSAPGWTEQAEPLPWPELSVTEFVTGLNQPVHVVGDGFGRLFITEKAGRIRLFKDGKLANEPFLDISDRVAISHECGLLSVAFPPSAAKNGYFFVMYNYDDQSTPEADDLIPPDDAIEPNNGCDTVLARFRVGSDPDRADEESEERLLLVNQPYLNHNGGQLAFGPDGFLYIGLGDGGSSGDPHDRSQKSDSLLGKLLRIEVGAAGAYTIPADNPFVGMSAYRPEIWALGLRNPWRFSFDRKTGDLYIGDVGQWAWEEINYQPASSKGGENYGWNTMEGAHCFPATVPCDQSGLTLPVVEYGHADPEGGSSVTGGVVYRGDEFPFLRGSYLYADYITGRIWGLRWDGDQPLTRKLLETGLTRAIVSFGQGDDGTIYLVDIRGTLYTVESYLYPDDLPKKSYLPVIAR